MRSASSLLVFDARQLQKFGVSESLIPPGSRLRFRTLTLWEAYHQIVIIIVAALVVQTGLIAALLVQRRRKRESEQRFRSLLDNAPDGVYVQTRERVAYVNREILQMLRAERPEQLIGQPVLDLVAPEWRKIVKERMQRVNKTADGPLPMIEEEYLRMDSSRVAVEVSAVPAVFDGDQGALVFVRDISERKRMDEKVRQLSRAVEQSPVSIVITNKDGNIEYVNRKFTEVTGYSFSEVIGKNPRILKSGELPAEVYQQMWKCIRDGQEWRGEFHNRKKNGELFWELSVISPIFNAAGAITHYLAVKEDITERRQLEERLRQSQKMEAFGQLAGRLAPGTLESRSGRGPGRNRQSRRTRRQSHPSVAHLQPAPDLSAQTARP
jgi:PAS domain S-box-containing protein